MKTIAAEIQIKNLKEIFAETRNFKVENVLMLYNIECCLLKTLGDAAGMIISVHVE